MGRILNIVYFLLSEIISALESSVDRNLISYDKIFRVLRPIAEAYYRDITRSVLTSFPINSDDKFRYDASARSFIRVWRLTYEAIEL